MTFEEVGIDTGGIVGQGKTTCPKCSPFRKKKHEHCLSFNTELGVAKCHNCGFAVATKGFSLKEGYTRKNYTIPVYKYRESDAVTEYMASRGISETTLKANKVGGADLFGDEEIAFPYIKDKVVNVKYRRLNSKSFRLVPGAEKPLYGLQNLFEDGVLSTKKIFITEGEIDALSMYEVGFPYTLSVPNGAGVEEEGKPQTTPRFEFLDDPDLVAIIGEMDEIVLATDSDYKGRRLAEELAKRFGIERCSRVSFPPDCKDANEVLVKYGADALVDCVLMAKPMLTGIVTVKDLRETALEFYKHGLEPGMPCGIDAIDEVFTLQLGLLTLVTGVPESGKSVVLDNMLAGYAKLNGLRSAIFSPETKPPELHLARLASIHNGFKFGTPEDAERMPYREYTESLEWIDEHFKFIQPRKNTLEEIMALAKVSVLQHGTNILVIDPYSRIVMESENEHRFIRNMLNELSEFGAKYNVHIFVVAHPVKIEPVGRTSNPLDIKDYPVVTPYNIKGASEWYNSADFILSLWRTRRLPDAPNRLYVLKSKYYHLAQSYQYAEVYYDAANFRLYS